MKNFAVLLFALLLFSSVKAQSNEKSPKEYVIVRVAFAVKKTGIICRMDLDTGSDKSFTMTGKVEETEIETLKFTMPDGQIKFATTEAQMLSYFAVYGFRPIHVYPLKIMTEDYIQYVLEKE